MAASHTEIFKVRSHEVDIHWRITLPSLIGLMQEAAGKSAKNLGASISDLHAKGTTWVMTRMKLDLTQYPIYEEDFAVETWPSGSERAFVYRDYRLYNDQKQLIGKATSTWLVLDIHTRRMTRVSEFLHPLTQVPVDFTPLPRATGKLVMPEEILNTVRFSVRWHDLDPNRHVNNTLYVQWALEALPESILANSCVSEIDVIIRAEGNFGDTIISTVAECGHHEYMHLITRESDGKLLAAGEDEVGGNPKSGNMIRLYYFPFICFP